MVTSSLLVVPQVRVERVGLCQQLLVRSLLNDAALAQDEDNVGIHNRRQAMSDKEAGPCARHLVLQVMGR